MFDSIGSLISASGTSLVQLVACMVAGLGIGFFSGLLGIGGGTMMVPVFRLLFGMSAHVASATSLFAIVPTSFSGISAHIRQKTAVPALGISAGLGGALCSPLGVYLGSKSPGWLLLSITACVILYSSISMLWKAYQGKGAKITPITEPAHPRITLAQALIAGLIGAAAGLIAGIAGVGGGFLMVPLFVSLLHVDTRLASGSSLIAMMILAIPGVIEQGMLGHIAYLPGIVVSCGTVPGAFLGARFVKKIPERRLKLIFGVFMMFIALLLVTRM